MIFFWVERNTPHQNGSIYHLVSVLFTSTPTSYCKIFLVKRSGRFRLRFNQSMHSLDGCAFFSQQNGLEWGENVCVGGIARDRESKYEHATKPFNSLVVTNVTFSVPSNTVHCSLDLKIPLFLSRSRFFFCCYACSFRSFASIVILTTCKIIFLT